MGRRLQPWAGITLALLIACSVGTAQAARPRTWAEWAPPPLASDSSFAALSSRPSDSLDVRQAAWVEVQRDWRKQRDDEAHGRYSSQGITDQPTPHHHARPSDSRFALLAARPYDSLREDEVIWLMVENNAQRAARQDMDTANNAAGLALLVGIVGGIALVAYTMSHTFWFP